MRTVYVGCLFGALLLAGSCTAQAQDAFIDQWSVERAQAHPDVELTIEIPKTTFYVGETIPVTFRYRSKSDEVYLLTHPPGWGLCETDVIADPPGRSVGHDGFAVGPRSGVDLSREPATYLLRLNECVRFTDPGTYRFYAKEQMLFRSKTEPRGLYPVSNVLTVEVVEAPPEWIARTIAEVKATLDGLPATGSHLQEQQRQAAIETIAFLDTPESLFSLMSYADLTRLRYLLQATAHPAEVWSAMDALLEAPDTMVTEPYVITMVRLAWEAGIAPNGSDPAGGYLARLAKSLPQKTQQARAVAVKTLLNRAGAMSPEPAWLPAVRAMQGK